MEMTIRQDSKFSGSAKQESMGGMLSLLSKEDIDPKQVKAIHALAIEEGFVTVFYCFQDWLIELLMSERFKKGLELLFRWQGFPFYTFAEIIVFASEENEETKAKVIKSETKGPFRSDLSVIGISGESKGKQQLLVDLVHEVSHLSRSELRMNLFFWEEGITSALSIMFAREVVDPFSRELLEDAQWQLYCLLGTEPSPPSLKLFQDFPVADFAYYGFCVQMAWAGLISKNPDFLPEFFVKYMLAVMDDPSIASNEEALLGLAVQVNPKFQKWYENKPFRAWYPNFTIEESEDAWAELMNR